MDLLFATWILLCYLFAGVPSLYYLYLKRAASKPWNLEVDKSYTPNIAIVIPMYNEEKTIVRKLENIEKVLYPREKMRIFLADDASTDKTTERASEFIRSHPEVHIKILGDGVRRGKSGVLNFALRHFDENVVIMTDADSLWKTNILAEALPYLADPSVGAIVGREELLNPGETWVTETEKLYFNLVYPVIRLGESKIHSTIILHGGFGAYKREFLPEFNREHDDSGTALDIVQKGARTILIPQAISFETSPVSWKGKLAIKLRRGSQLIQLWAKCFKLALKGNLRLPLKIAIPETFLYVFNPIIFLALIVVTLGLLVRFPYFSIVFALILIGIVVYPKSRISFIEYIQNYLVLLFSIFNFVRNRKFIAWETQKESRSFLAEKAITEKTGQGSENAVWIYSEALEMEPAKDIILPMLEREASERLLMKNGWKRALYSLMQKMFRRVCYEILCTEKRWDGEGIPNLGVDEFGRDISVGMHKYVNLLKKRGLEIHTVLVLGSRAKGRWKPESDVDTLVVAGNLPGKSYISFTSPMQKILGLKRWFMLSDSPLFIGVQPSGSCSREEFLQRLESLELSALDAIFFGKVIYDDGFWAEVEKRFEGLQNKYEFEKERLKQILLPL